MEKDKMDLSEKELQEWKKWAEEYEEQSISEEGGAGEEGTDKLTRRYKMDTPGQEPGMTADNAHNN